MQSADISRLIDRLKDGDKNHTNQLNDVDGDEMTIVYFRSLRP